MDRRVHGTMDGERSAAELTPAERRRLEAYEKAADAALASLADERCPDVAPGVMTRIAALEAAAEGAQRASPDADRAGAGLAQRLRRAWSWLWRPREVRVRPAWAFAAAAALVVAIALPGRPTAPTVVQEAAPGTPSEPTVLVQFRLDAPEATSVRLAGDFTGWKPAYELRKQAPGVWSVVVPLRPGVHDYAFVVDGEQWRPDPLAPSIRDGFGGTNSRLALMAPTPGSAL